MRSRCRRFEMSDCAWGRHDLPPLATLPFCPGTRKAFDLHIDQALQSCPGAGERVTRMADPYQASPRRAFHCHSARAAAEADGLISKINPILLLRGQTRCFNGVSFV